MNAVCTGSLDESERDILFVGTPTNLLAYDVENNSDLFYKDVSSPYLFVSLRKELSLGASLKLKDTNFKNLYM